MIETLEYKALSAAKDAVECARQKGANMDDLGNAATKAWGVLQEHGIFAAFLWLAAQGRATEREKEGDRQQLSSRTKKVYEKEPIASISRALWKSLNDSDLVESELNKEERRPALKACELLANADSGLFRNLSKLLLARRILEQVLLYLRYCAKASGER
ncbi:MAG: hypothetical protein DRP82_07225 [Planctomycetota bacterium]|nr:MAG: hypothetical protein DRP82_07225 [Planctomycetota bacterium]